MCIAPVAGRKGKRWQFLFTGFLPIFAVVYHQIYMPVLRFRVFWEEDDQVYRDVEIKTGQSFLELHKVINQSFEFDGKHPASFYESNERWQRGREINSEVMVNKKDAPALSMMRTPVSALVATPDQKFVYTYDPVKNWTFQVTLIGVTAEEDPKRTYPFCFRKEGVAPAQYGIKGVNPDKLMEVEEKYDLGAEEMAEGFSSEGEDGSSESFGGGGEATESHDE